MFKRLDLGAAQIKEEKLASVAIKIGHDLLGISEKSPIMTFDDDDCSRLYDKCILYMQVMGQLYNSPSTDWDTLAEKIGTANSILRVAVNTMNTWLSTRHNDIMRVPDLVEGTPGVGQSLTTLGVMVWREYLREKKSKEYWGHRG